MRIAQIVSGIGLNGVAVHVASLTRQLLARGHRVTVVCRPGSWIERELADTADVVASHLDRWPLDELRRIARILSKRQCDVIHSHMSRAHVFALLLKPFARLPVVATAHSQCIQPHWMMNDHVIAVSQAVARFQRRWNRVRPNRLTVVHNFVDTLAFDALSDERPRVRAALGVDDSVVLIGKIGNLFREKGVHDLIDAMPFVLAEAPRARLLVQGRGPDDYRRELRAKASGHRIDSKVIWLPEVEPADVKRTFAALDIMVVPSLVEPLSTVCLEAMAAGVPVVATRTGGLPELVEHGKTGVLVPPSSPCALADAIVALACDGDQRKRYGREGRARARRLFSVRDKAADIERVFADVIAQQQHGASRERLSSLPVFDPARAHYRSIVLPCTKVIDLLPLSHAPDLIASYRRQMREGARFPPVSVIRLGTLYLVADGHKRFSAYQQLGHDEVVVEVWPLRRWLLDQWRQVCGNARKNGRIVATSFSDPLTAWRLLLTTLLHWRRVARSLAARVAGRLS